MGKGRRRGCSRLHNCTVHSANVSILSINPWYKSNLSSGRRGGGIPRGVDGTEGLKKVKRWKRGECKQSPARFEEEERENDRERKEREEERKERRKKAKKEGKGKRQEGRKEGRKKSFPLATRRTLSNK